MRPETKQKAIRSSQAEGKGEQENENREGNNKGNHKTNPTYNQQQYHRKQKTTRKNNSTKMGIGRMSRETESEMERPSRD